MTNFKDVAHLYLGCKVQTDYGLLKMNMVSADNMFQLERIYDGLVTHTTAEKLRPILRPLSSITKAEAAYVLEHVFCPNRNYPLSDFKLELVGEQAKNPRIKLSNDWFDENLTFGNDTGSIWAVDNYSQNVKIPATVYAYLLQNHFDLFGLIAAGEAIDATILTTNPIP